MPDASEAQREACRFALARRCSAPVATFDLREPMVTAIILGMLCVHLLCFSMMCLLISTRLKGKTMGMEIFALGNLLLGLAYILQLLEGQAGWGLMSLINHTLTLSAPVAYVLGAMRCFERPTPVLRPLLMLVVVYTAAQV